MMISSLSFQAFSQVRDYYIDIVPQVYDVLSFDYMAFITTESEAGTLCVGDSTVRFKNEMSIVNYMASKGWTLVNMVETLLPEMASNITESIAGKGVTDKMRQHHYLMKKQANTYDEAIDGILLLDRKAEGKVKKEEKKRKREARRKTNEGKKDDLYYTP